MFAVRLTTLLLLAGDGVMSLAAQSSGQEQALRVNVSSADARYTIAMLWEFVNDTGPEPTTTPESGYGSKAG